MNGKTLAEQWRELATNAPTIRPDMAETADSLDALPSNVPARVDTSVRFGDIELSRLFAGRNKDRLIWLGDTRYWLSWDGVKWARDDDAADRAVKEFVDWLAESARTMPEGAEKERAMKLSVSYTSYSKCQNIIKFARSDMARNSSEFDTRFDLLNFKNGTLELDTLEFREHRPGDLITRVAGCDYDPQADASQWEAFLDETFASGGETDTQLLRYVQRMAGRALGGDTALERMLVLVGRPRSGKSTFCETVAAALGDYARHVAEETVTVNRRTAGAASEDLARLEGARLAIVPELKKGALLDASLIKRMTGGDNLTARRLYAETHEFKPHFNMWFNTNDLPEVNDDTLFESGRLVPVPFVNQRPPERRDLGLKARLSEPENLAACINWLIEGWTDRESAGLGLPDASAVMLEGYRARSDKLGLFLNDACEFDPDVWETGNDLYREWRYWCEENGRKAGASQNFYEDLKKRDGVTWKKRAHIGDKQPRNVFGGIRLTKRQG